MHNSYRYWSPLHFFKLYFPRDILLSLTIFVFISFISNKISLRNQTRKNKDVVLIIYLLPLRYRNLGMVPVNTFNAVVRLY